MKLLTLHGGEVKTLNENGLIGGYLIRFGSPNDTDLTGDFFTKDTDFGIAKNSPVLYNHGFDVKMQLKDFGIAEHVKVDDIGLWIETQLSLRDNYEKAIFELARQGKLGWSSGTASHLVKRTAIGDSHRIDRWHLGLDASLTPTPAEYRNHISVKSFEEITKDLDINLDKLDINAVKIGAAMNKNRLQRLADAITSLQSILNELTPQGSWEFELNDKLDNNNTYDNEFNINDILTNE